jgi:hypothetical protein
MNHLAAYTEEDLERQIIAWKQHPITAGLLEFFRQELELSLVNGVVPHLNSNSSFDYDVGYKDGKSNTIYKLLKPEIWLYNSLDRGENND